VALTNDLTQTTAVVILPVMGKHIGSIDEFAARHVAKLSILLTVAQNIYDLLTAQHTGLVAGRRKTVKAAHHLASQ
jgi:hypothetical protein